MEKISVQLINAQNQVYYFFLVSFWKMQNLMKVHKCLCTVKLPISMLCTSPNLCIVVLMCIK